MPAVQAMTRETIFSPCRAYRYTLWREFDLDQRGGYAMFIGLNPSTADEVQDDPTIRRCIGFAKRWGYGALCMTNLFAYRAIDPLDMKRHPHPVGPENEQHLVRCAAEAGVVVAAWGTHGYFMARGREVSTMLDDLHCLGVTKDGSPKHPLYLPKNAELRTFGLHGVTA